MKGLIGFMAKHTIQIDVVSMYGPGKPIPDVKQASPAENVTADARLVRQLISIPLYMKQEQRTLSMDTTSINTSPKNNPAEVEAVEKEMFLVTLLRKPPIVVPEKLHTNSWSS